MIDFSDHANRLLNCTITTTSNTPFQTNLNEKCLPDQQKYYMVGGFHRFIYALMKIMHLHTVNVIDICTDIPILYFIA